MPVFRCHVIKRRNGNNVLNKPRHGGLDHVLKILYGLVSLAIVFINILTIVGDLGLNQALIQKKNPDEEECNSVFYANLLFNLGLYLLIFFTAPLGAAFYEEPRLTGIIRVSALTLLISAVFSMHETIITKEMQFRKYFWATITGTILSSVIEYFSGSLVHFNSFISKNSFLVKYFD